MIRLIATYLKKSGLLIMLVVTGSSVLNAQQLLNLDFETRSAKNPVRPWGWDENSYSPQHNYQLDSIVRHDKLFSLRLEGKENADPSSFQSIVAYLEPFALQGKTITISGWSRKLMRGQLYVKLEYGMGDTIAGDSAIIEHTYGWKRFSFKTTLPHKVDWARLNIIQYGKDTAWLDGLSLMIEGKKINSLPVAPVFTKQQMSWLADHTSKVNATAAGKEDQPYSADDLDKFKEICVDATIIALGEATHGTSEFFSMKHRVLEYAVRKMGVRLFIMEDHQLIVQNVNDFVLGGKGDAKSAMSGMFGVWDNQEVLNMVQWVRNYNMQHPDDMVEFVGMDMQSATVAFTKLYSFLEQKDSILYSEIKSILANLKKNESAIYMSTDSAKLIWKADTEKAFELIAQKRQPWLLAAHNKKDSVTIEWAVQYARIIKQFAKESIDPMALYRDEAMAENVSWILQQRKPGTRAILWAHDVHISRGENPQRELNYHHGISMGSWLAKKYGSAYKAFGLYSYEGAYRSFPSYSDYSKWISCPLYPGPQGSIDHALHIICQTKKAKALLFDLSTGRQQSWLSAGLPVRFANHVCYEYAYWTRFSIPYQFDGIIFIDKTSPATKMAK